jgi:hypothetical protein
MTKIKMPDNVLAVVHTRLEPPTIDAVSVSIAEGGVLFVETYDPSRPNSAGEDVTLAPASWSRITYKARPEHR